MGPFGLKLLCAYLNYMAILCGFGVVSTPLSPPAPRLVGIEPNPGPRGRKSKVGATRTLDVKISPAAAPAPKRKAKAARSRGSSKGDGSLLGKFKLSAENPFDHRPPLLGFASFQDNIYNVGWSRNIGIALTADATCFCAMFAPVTLQADATGNWGTTQTPGYLNFVSAVDPATAIGAGTAAAIGPVNGTELINDFEAFRPITGAVRVTVRYPLTAAPGRLYALNLSDSAGVLATRSYTELDALNIAKPALNTGGTSVIQGNWRQGDVTDFWFEGDSYVMPTSVLSGYTLIVGVGWEAGTFKVDLESIVHIEAQSGSIATSHGGTIEENLATTLSLEQLYAHLRSIPACLNKEQIMLSENRELMRAVQVSSRQRQSRGFSKRQGPVHGPAMPVEEGASSSFADYVMPAAMAGATYILNQQVRRVRN
jgi:hypothetical protein